MCENSMSLKARCPECDEPLTVYLDPPELDTGITAATIQEIEGACEHIDTLLEDDRFYEEVMQTANDAYEDEMESRYDRWRDGQFEREQAEHERDERDYS